MSEKTVWLFDVDGTLTPSRGAINDDFKNKFLKFCEKNTVYLVSGSEHYRTVEQMGKDIDDHVRGIFSCNGNELWVRGKLRSEVKWQMMSECFEFLDKRLVDSEFSDKTGAHYDVRFGMVNFSVLGRNCSDEQRQAYYDWDCENHERDSIAEAFNNEYSERLGSEAVVAGQTGIDISGMGMDKGRVLETMSGYSKVNFVCDAAQKGGNDYALAKGIRGGRRGEVFEVDGWEGVLEVIMERNR